ncbi:hypothetical protein M1615_02585 [Patescibacteria group bacterium]|nr:hypothetical protein [Patescibacteria group bacterium]
MRNEQDHGNRLRGTGRVLGAGALVFSLAACGSSADKTPSQIPNTQPAETPSPIVTQSEMPSLSLSPKPSISVEISPIPTVAPTPEATPKPTPKPVETIINSKLPETPVTITNVKNDIQVALKANPSIKAQWTNVNSTLEECQYGVAGQNTSVTRFQSCENITLIAYKLYQSTGDKRFYNLALATYDYTLGPNGVGSSFKQQLDSYLKQFA